MNPNNDGVDHLNVFSKAKTWLGVFLSNFSDCNVVTEDGPFRTIEGYWYWLSCRDDRLRTTSGFESKRLGRNLRSRDYIKSEEFNKKILKAIALKLVGNERCITELKACKLPIVHYYVYGNRVIEPKDGLWMMSFLDAFRLELQKDIQV